MPANGVQDRDLRHLSMVDAARMPPAAVLATMASPPAGLSGEDAARRLSLVGPNAVRTHRASGWSVLGRQLRSPILILLLVTAGLSLFLGDVTNSIVIGVILLVSVGLGFSNEFRAERAAEALHSRVTHRAVVVRDGTPQEVDVTALVPGDIVHLAIGAIIPADMRLLSAKDLLCDESILTGESMPVGKDPAPVPGAMALGDLTSCLFMGTVIQAGNCAGVVVCHRRAGRIRPDRT